MYDDTLKFSRLGMVPSTQIALLCRAYVFFSETYIGGVIVTTI